MKKETKEGITGIIIIVLIIVVMSWAIESLSDSIYQPNCWEDKIEGINIETGNNSYHSENFNCDYFKSTE